MVDESKNYTGVVCLLCKRRFPVSAGNEAPEATIQGLGAVVAAHVNARKLNRRILFAAFNGQVRTLIEMTHVNDILQTYDTIQDAVVAYGGC